MILFSDPLVWDRPIGLDAVGSVKFRSVGLDVKGAASKESSSGNVMDDCATA